MKTTVVVADFYRDIADALLESCTTQLAECETQIVRVPGALEIPFALLVAARSAPDAMVALGCVIRGETHHFEVVADTSAHGVLQVQMQTGVPVGNGILTVDNMAQARARTGKGADAARAALQLARLAREGHAG